MLKATITSLFGSLLMSCICTSAMVWFIAGKDVC
ncbi:unnamed protein product [Spirodela intermedia]|uniref:Uncharacterized protein n=1 Tax=Spirodela intermedia TaxID=51605 RepID=A0A7I8L060_SPIIN|nr:unnamed protein product [Spirodela intermedia]